MAPRYLWFRGGDVAVDAASGAVTLSPRGHATPTVVSPTRSPTAGLQLPAPLAAAPHAAYSLGGGRPLGLREGGGGAPSLDAVRTVVRAARATELARYAAYGEHAEVKEALQAATMWNYIYTPAEYGPFLPVSRAWNFVKGNVNLDWAYVIFDWDNIFASYMTSLDPRAKDIAYSNYIQVSEQVTYSLTYSVNLTLTLTTTLTLTLTLTLAYPTTSRWCARARPEAWCPTIRRAAPSPSTVPSRLSVPRSWWRCMASTATTGWSSSSLMTCCGGATGSNHSVSSSSFTPTLTRTLTPTLTLTLTRWSDWFAAERMHGPLGPI